ncbi:MAG: hypothetical protein AAB738_00555 [Patescibacteria group bacterium]
MKNTKGFASVWLVVLIVVVAAGLGYFAFKNKTQNPPEPKIECGGYAGVVCPTGYTCITNPKIKDSIGYCKKEVFKTQEDCETKTGEQCFLFKGLCQVLEARNRSEAEANEKFLKDCLSEIGTWQPIEAASQTTSDISDWQTYRNDKYGFEIKYPKELIGPTDPNQGISDGGTFYFALKEGDGVYGVSRIYFQINPNGARDCPTIEDCLSGFNWIKNGTLKDVTVDGLPAKEYASLTPSGKEFILVFFKKGNDLYEFGNNGESNGKESVTLALQILSTFKFSK